MAEICLQQNTEPRDLTMEYSCNNTNLDYFGCSLKCHHLLKKIDDKTLETAENKMVELFGGIRSIITHFIKYKLISLQQYNNLFLILGDINPPDSSEIIVNPNLSQMPNEIISSIAQYLNLIDLRSFQLVNVSFALLGRLPSNLLNAKVMRSIQNCQVTSILNLLLTNNQQLIINKLNNIIYKNKNNAKSFCENGIIYHIINLIKSDHINSQLKMAAINFIGKLTEYGDNINNNSEYSEIYYIYMRELISHNAIQSFYNKQYQLFLTPANLKYNIYCKQDAIWECKDIRAFRQFEGHWKSRGKGTIKIYNVEHNGICRKLLTFFDEKRNVIRLLQFLNQCINHKSYPLKSIGNDNISYRFEWCGIDQSTKYDSYDNDMNIIEYSDDISDELDVFSFKFIENEQKHLKQLQIYFDSEYNNNSNDMCVGDDDILKQFNFIEYDHIFCNFYALNKLAQDAVLQILSDDGVEKHKIGIKYLSTILRKNGNDSEALSNEDLDNLIRTGIILKIINLCESNDCELQYMAVDTLTNIASINDEFTIIISIFGGIEVLGQLLKNIHKNIKDSNYEMEHKCNDRDFDCDLNQLLEATIWCIGNISGTIECRTKLHEYKIYDEIMGNVLEYIPKNQNVATWTITHIFSDKDEMNSDIINSLNNVSEILLGLLKSANSNNDIQMCQDVLFCAKEYVNQSDDHRTNKACGQMIKSHFLQYLFDYIHSLLYLQKGKDTFDKTCLSRAAYTLHSIIDQSRIYECDNESKSMDLKNEIIKCLSNKDNFKVLTHRMLLSKRGGQYAQLWLVSYLLSENDNIIQWMIDLNDSSFIEHVINIVKLNKFNCKKIENEACIVITSIIQMATEAQIESLIKIGIIEGIFFMMDYNENIIECIYCIDIIYRLTDCTHIISPYIAKLDELLVLNEKKKSNNNKSKHSNKKQLDQRTIRKIKSTKQRYANMLK